MDIDLSLLYSNAKEEIDISNTYNIPKSYITNDDVIALDGIKVEGIITKEEDSLYVKMQVTGEMLLKDSISLEAVSYPFSLEYDDILEENCKKNENTLDIFQFLWENIVLEVPLQFTKVSDLSKYHGDGWKLISEDDLIKSNNPFTKILEDDSEE